MERRIETKHTHTSSIKNVLAIWAIALVLLGNSDNIVAQTQQTKQDLAKNMTKTPQDSLKTRFVQSFSPIINMVKDVDDLPLKVRFKDRNLVENHHFPEYIDIHPKTINKPTNLLTIILGDKMYKIVPYKGIKISDMHIVDNHNDLNAPKVVISLQLVWLFPRDIDISTKEFSEYIYKLSQMPVGQKTTIWGIHVEVLARNNKSPITPKNLTDSNTIKNDPMLANDATE